MLCITLLPYIMRGTVRPAGWVDLGIVSVSRFNSGNRASDIAKGDLVSRDSRGDTRLYVGLTWAIP